MSDDLAFENDAASSKRGVKQGRRAQSKQPAAPAAPEFESTSNTTPPPSKPEADGPPKPSRVSGWGEDAPKRRGRNLGEGFETFEDDDIFHGLDIESELAKKPKSRKQQGWGSTTEDERLRPQTPDNGDDSDNDIPVIPDLEDQVEEDMTQSIAYAPNVAVNRVATYRELDNDLLKQAAFLTLDNEIDLKLLTKSLSTEADLLEEDKLWDWDRLFTEVTSELITQLEQDETLDPAEKQAPIQTV